MSFTPCKFLLIVLFQINPATVLSQPAALVPPDETRLAEARSMIAAMKKNERGPYSRLRWFCRDGSVHPPQPYACKDRGGGYQHAEYSGQRAMLAEMGYHVGTIFTALEWQEFWGPDNRHQRMRELALEKFMQDIDDGWVLQKAQHYRGRVQLENELEKGRQLLLRLLGDASWLSGHYLLAREMVRVVPHHGGTDLTRNVRRRSTELAAKAPGFERIRVEIHTTPSARTVTQVREWIARQNDAALIAEAGTIMDELEDLYGVAGRKRRIHTIKTAIARFPGLEALQGKIGPGGNRHLEQLQTLGDLLAGIRTAVQAPLNPEARLLLLNLLPEINAELTTATGLALAETGHSRADQFIIISALIDATYGNGLVLREEYLALTGELERISSATTVPVETYREAIRYLSLVTAWAYDTVRFTFAEPLQRYTALDPRAGRFVDDMLRESPAALLARVLNTMTRDVLQLSGVKRSLFGKADSGLTGLNPGFSRGRLRVMSEQELLQGPGPDRGEIVVVPQTVAELKPVAGILTTGEGNLLSHVQLLARNFGIPNVAVSPELAGRLQQYDGREIILLVASNGSVIVEQVSNLPEKMLQLVSANPAVALAEKLDVPTPDLAWTRPIELAELHRGLSGKRVGPKAANLGELNRMFPGRVAPAFALPFGIYNQHVSSGVNPPRSRLVSAYQRYRKGQLTSGQLDAELATIRDDIAKLVVVPALRSELRALMQQLFDVEENYGVFIRSDTNVEDLPGFTGAGLSETLANVVGFDTQMQGIPRVWSSILSERAIAWRSNLLSRPEEIYASVLVMKSVAADKSGVLVTTDLWSRSEGLTIATARGVGGAVGGESAETLVLRTDGGERLLSTAKSPYRRVLSGQGGIQWQATAAGPVLTSAEKVTLKELAAEVAKKARPERDEKGKPLPWDIEFGFVDGRLTLFQMRPLVERGQQRADHLAQVLAGDQSGLKQSVSLHEPVQWVH